MSFLRPKTPRLEKFQPVGINAGGVAATFGDNAISITPGAQRTGLVSDISRTFNDQAGNLAQLRSQVTPGFGALTRARLAEIETGRRRAIGNLAQNLQNRRIFGSSFAQASLAQAEREFTQAREAASAESFLQELELSNQLLDQEFEARRGEFQIALDDLNFQTDVATQLASQATTNLGANARLQAQLNAQSASGAGGFFGTVLGIGARLFAPKLLGA